MQRTFRRFLVGDNAVLYAAKGLVHLQYREAGIDFSERPLQVAETCAGNVFALDSASVLGLQLRGWIHYSRGRIQDAVRDLTAAIAIDANNPDALGLLSNCCLISGKVDAARPIIARLIAVDPLTPINRCMPGFADIMEGRFATALGPYRLMLDMDPGNPMARLFYVWVLLLNGRRESVRAILDAFPFEVRDTFPARLAFFLADAFDGHLGDPRAMLGPDVEAMAAASDVFARILAQSFARAGIHEAALRWLEIAIERGFVNHPFPAQHDPFLKTLRSDPRFSRLLEIARGRWERFEVSSSIET